MAQSTDESYVPDVFPDGDTDASDWFELRSRSSSYPWIAWVGGTAMGLFDVVLWLNPALLDGVTREILLAAIALGMLWYVYRQTLVETGIKPRYEF